MARARTWLRHSAATSGPSVRLGFLARTPPSRRRVARMLARGIDSDTLTGVLFDVGMANRQPVARRFRELTVSVGRRFPPAGDALIRRTHEACTAYPGGYLCARRGVGAAGGHPRARRRA